MSLTNPVLNDIVIKELTEISTRINTLDSDISTRFNSISTEINNYNNKLKNKYKTELKDDDIVDVILRINED